MKKGAMNRVFVFGPIKKAVFIIIEVHDFKGLPVKLYVYFLNHLFFECNKTFLISH
jgi:hypothetical protein